MTAERPPTPPPTWSFWRETIASAERPDAFRTAGLWAIDCLQRRLGEDWPCLAWDKFGRLPAGIGLSATHTLAFAELLELALRLELCAGCHRFPRLRRRLATNPNEDEVQHLRLQLEVATLALQAGHDVAFEPPVTPGARHTDLELRLQGGTTALVEARALLMSEAMQRATRFSDEVFAGIRAIAARYGLQCEGEITSVLDERETAALLAEFERHARLSADGVILPAFRAHGATLSLAPQQTVGGGLSGPSTEGDVWPRLAARLLEKAEQTRGAQAVWLRLDARQGLWQFTRWTAEGLPAKLILLEHNVSVTLAEHPHVAGVVMSPGSLHAQGSFVDEDYEHPDGSFAMRRLIAPLRVRETLVIPLAGDDGARVFSRAWRELYASEPGWLGRALAAFGLPPVDEIFAPVSDSI